MGYVFALLFGIWLGRIWHHDVEWFERFERDSKARHQRLMDNLKDVLKARLCPHGIDEFRDHCEPCAVNAETKQIGLVFDYPTFRRRNQ